MWKKINQFFKITGFEALRITRNKFVLTMLFVFAVIIVFATFFVQDTANKYPIAVFKNSVEVEQTQVGQFIDENLGTTKVVYVNSDQEGFDLIKKREVCFLISFIPAEDGEQPTAMFYFDRTSPVGLTVYNELMNKRNEYAYNKIIETLQKYGITLNESYFKLVKFQSVNDRHVYATQMTFPMEIACCVAIVIMLGLAYSIARDNETNVSKNMAYIPVGVNRYLFSKILPFFALGMIEISLMLLIGLIAFKITFALNFFLILLLCSLFVLAITMLGTLFSLLKSQISTIFIDMLVILVPLFINMIVYVPAAPPILKFLLYALPITPFADFLYVAIFNGIILWESIVALAIQIVVYYALTAIILKRKVKR